jgi:hypothetical protein
MGVREREKMRLVGWEEDQGKGEDIFINSKGRKMRLKKEGEEGGRYVIM